VNCKPKKTVKYQNTSRIY